MNKVGLLQPITFLINDDQAPDTSLGWYICLRNVPSWFSSPTNAFWNQIRNNLINIAHYFCFRNSYTWKNLELFQEPMLLR